MPSKKKQPAKKGASDRDVQGTLLVQVKESPPMIGYAHFCAASDRYLSIDFQFAATVAVGELKLLFAVALPVDALSNSIWKTFETFGPQVQQLLTERGLKPEPVRPGIGSVKVRPEARLLTANLMQAYRSGASAQLDFYYLSPRTVHEHKGDPNKPVFAQPVVSVGCSIALLGGLLQYIEQNLSQFRSRFVEPPPAPL